MNMSFQNLRKKAAAILTEKNVSIFSALIALLAMVGSVRGCQATSDQTALLLEQNNERFQIILDADIDPADNSILLSPIDSEQALASGVAYFPTAVLSEPAPIRRGGTLYFTGELDLNLKQYVMSRVEAVEGYEILGHLPVPIYVRTQFYVGGEIYEDVSRYILLVEFVLSDKRTQPSITYTDFNFAGRARPNDKVDVRELDTLFAAMSAHLVNDYESAMD